MLILLFTAFLLKNYKKNINLNTLGRMISPFIKVKERR
jgi:hypothetical protein